MENAAWQAVGKRQECVNEQAVGRTAVDDQWQMEACGPFSLALQDGHLFFAPRFVPIKVDAHFADGNVGMVGRFEQALHVVERRFHLFRRVGQFRWVKPHHGAAEVGMLLTKLQHGAN